MKLYLDDKKINKDYSEFTITQILDDVKAELDDKIIKKIYLNKIQINEKYLKESLVNKEDINEIRFITQNNDNLIKETLKSIDSYLPRLKKGCVDTAYLFRNGELDKANNKIQLIFDGINWYTESTNSIVILLESKKLQKKIYEHLISINSFLEELNEAQEKEDNILIADILEFEIVEFIDIFIDLNKDIKNYFQRKEER